MIGRIKRWLAGPAIKDLSLQFTMDVDPDGNHVFRVFMDTEEGRLPVREPWTIWEYGGTIVRDGTRYHLSSEDYARLLCVRALNPKFGDAGEIITDICPPSLRYLRQQRNVEEGPGSQALEVSEERIGATALIEYKKGEGLEIRTGYRLPGTHTFKRREELNPTPDGQFTRVGNTFYQLPESDSPEVS